MRSSTVFLPTLVVGFVTGCAVSPPMIAPPPPGEVAAGPPAASPAPTASSPSPGEHLPEFGEYVQVDELPIVLTQVSPERPAGFSGEGTVLIQALVGTDGRVRDTRVIKSIPGLDAAAAVAVRQWVFQPAKRQDQPIATWVACPVVFQ